MIAILAKSQPDVNVFSGSIMIMAIIKIVFLSIYSENLKYTAKSTYHINR